MAMIYGYTFRAPWLGNYRMLYCKNISFNEHIGIFEGIRMNGGSYLIQGLPEGSDQYNMDYIRPHSKDYMLQYGGRYDDIYKVIHDFNIQIFTEFDQNRIKQEELDIISEMDLATKLEQNY